MKLTRDLAPIREKAKARVDAAAEAARLAYITPGSGQAMAYEQKYAEALAFVANPSLTPADAPHVYAEIGITGATAREVAETIVAMRRRWLEASAQIEAARLGAKAAIDGATTPAGIEEATAIVWPSP